MRWRDWERFKTSFSVNSPHLPRADAKCLECGVLHCDVPLVEPSLTSADSCQRIKHDFLPDIRLFQVPGCHFVNDSCVLALGFCFGFLWLSGETGLSVSIE